MDDWNDARDIDVAALLAEKPSPETLALAKRALDAQESRKGEDVQAWAERLAADVVQLND